LPGTEIDRQRATLGADLAHASITGPPSAARTIFPLKDLAGLRDQQQRPAINRLPLHAGQPGLCFAIAERLFGLNRRPGVIRGRADCRRLIALSLALQMADDCFGDVASCPLDLGGRA
jgi:hypothetical protein